ncbi:SCO4226 family nickel-binding protein [Streptomyces sp. GQFP]|uniref:SCO4226 family nickel-binding protein n=1 Tax=Streptomyces sp. GQFP TaxID=2907545 RepID=UPI001F4714BE|nr:SCO4226 family nickel-binding protein [Streptomyces sp. GQFP]UIX32999.1 SCO4226 family nickel-binding protein [Streptomyces sp. GQFP]
MTQFMDVHHGAKGITAEQLQQGHDAAVAIQKEEGVRFERAWADPEAGVVYCLTEASSADAVQRAHIHAGSDAPDEIHAVPLSV